MDAGDPSFRQTKDAGAAVSTNLLQKNLAGRQDIRGHDDRNIMRLVNDDSSVECEGEAYFVETQNATTMFVTLARCFWFYHVNIPIGCVCVCVECNHPIGISA